MSRARARAARACAQAKINLVLRVLAREASGYHQIETLFLRVELGDVVTVRAGGSRRALDVGDMDLGPTDRNLAMCAAVAYQEATGWPSGFEIGLVKSIPVGAGLGGGSADAGAVLRALNALAPHPASAEALLAIAGSLGADVPFLTLEIPYALAWGRGQRLLELPPPESRELLVVVPPFAVRTADAYEWIPAGSLAGPVTPLRLGVDELSTWRMIERLGGNDFEPVVAKRHAEIVEIIGVLRAHGARLAQLTGSGSAVIGVFDAVPDFDAVSAAVHGEVIRTRTASRVVEVEFFE